MNVHAEVICGRLAAELNAWIRRFPSALEGLEAEEIYRCAPTLPRTVRSEIRRVAGGVACHEYFFRYMTSDDEIHCPAADLVKRMLSPYVSA